MKRTMDERRRVETVRRANEIASDVRMNGLEPALEYLDAVAEGLETLSEHSHGRKRAAYRRLREILEGFMGELDQCARATGE